MRARAGKRFLSCFFPLCYRYQWNESLCFVYDKKQEYISIESRNSSNSNRKKVKINLYLRSGNIKNEEIITTFSIVFSSSNFSFYLFLICILVSFLYSFSYFVLFHPLFLYLLFHTFCFFFRKLKKP